MATKSTTDAGCGLSTKTLAPVGDLGLCCWLSCLKPGRKSNKQSQNWAIWGETSMLRLAGRNRSRKTSPTALHLFYYGTLLLWKRPIALAFDNFQSFYVLSEDLWCSCWCLSDFRTYQAFPYDRIFLKISWPLKVATTTTTQLRRGANEASHGCWTLHGLKEGFSRGWCACWLKLSRFFRLWWHLSCWSDIFKAALVAMNWDGQLHRPK